MALRQEEFTSLCDDVDLDRDRALVERCQAGDSGAFGNLYARYYERLLRFCLRRLNDRHEAEDAAQEAFARAWKALPNFAGERRFYPWLTVIAGNICTDMLRRRSRSTPTDDFELRSHQPVGGGGIDTSEEYLIAAVDGELVNKALDRLSVRHRHVLAMREGSGWTYQQIADHEGVEIGTIETLLWRARQALKREFNVLSESKGALAGLPHRRRCAGPTGSPAGGHRDQLHSRQWRAVSSATPCRGSPSTSAAVAAAFIAPHAFSGTGSSAQAAQSAPAGAADRPGRSCRWQRPLGVGRSPLVEDWSPPAADNVAPNTPLAGRWAPNAGPLRRWPLGTVSPASGRPRPPVGTPPPDYFERHRPDHAGSGLVHGGIGGSGRRHQSRGGADQHFAVVGAATAPHSVRPRLPARVIRAVRAAPAPPLRPPSLPLHHHRRAALHGHHTRPDSAQARAEAPAPSAADRRTFR